MPMYAMRTEYAVTPAQMKDWQAVCEKFAEKVEAELLFVNETSCGVQYKNGTFQHIYIDEMAEYFKRMEEKEKTDKDELSR